MDNMFEENYYTEQNGNTEEAFQKEEQKECGSKDLDTMQVYMDDISAFQLLSKEEEAALGKRIAEGDNDARNELCDANYRLVVKFAKKYTYSGLDLEDLIQAGNLGLIKAAEKYDYTLGYCFSTYASQWILQSIRRTIADTGRTIRVPVHAQEAYTKQYKATEKLTQKLGKIPDIDDIAEELGCSKDKIYDLQTAMRDTTSLDNQITDEDDTDMYAIIPDENAINPETSAINASLRDDLEKTFSSLSERETEVLKLRYGWDNGDRMTLEEIADKYGLTRERIRQIEETALRKLRHSRKAIGLKEYLAA